MPTRRAILLALAALCAAAHARAAGTRAYDILSLRLAMPASAVLDQLHAQGIPPAAIQLDPPGCAAARADLCAQAIRTRTRDGPLLIQFTGAPDAPERQVVYRIAYTIIGRGPADAATLRADAIDRYGPPTSPATTTWCPRLDLASGTCPANQPRLRLVPAPGAAGMLVLSDESLPVRR